MASSAFRSRSQFVIDLEYCFQILALLLVTASLNPIFYIALGDNSDSYTDSNPMKLATSILIYLVAASILLLEQDSVVRLVRSSPIILVVIALPLMSVLWSVDPMTSLKRSLAHALTVLFCIYIVCRLSPQQFFERLLVVMFIGAAACFLYTATFPSQAITQGEVNRGAWAGIYLHKNDLGRMSSIAILLTASFRPSTRLLRAIRWLTLGGFVILLVMSESKTNAVVAAGGLGLLPVFAIAQKHKLATWVRLLILIVAAAILIFMATVGGQLILQSLGRDDSFSGRETIWRGVNAVVLENYFPLGAGYGAFFTERGAVQEMGVFLQHWIMAVPTHAHSGYWQTWADMAVPGVSALAVLILTAAWRLFGRLLFDTNRGNWRTFTLMLFLFVVACFSETLAFKHSEVSWVLLMLGVLYARQPSIVISRIAERTEKQAALRAIRADHPVGPVGAETMRRKPT